jgi:hypothetical protein
MNGCSSDPLESDVDVCIVDDRDGFGPELNPGDAGLWQQKTRAQRYPDLGSTDLEFLREGAMLNDTVIQFYVRWAYLLAHGLLPNQ